MTAFDAQMLTLQWVIGVGSVLTVIGVGIGLWIAWKAFMEQRRGNATATRLARAMMMSPEKEPGPIAAGSTRAEDDDS